MKRSLTLVCVLGLGATALAQASNAADPTPSAPAPTTAAAPVGPTKVAIIQFQQAVAATNEGQRDFSELRQKFEPKQTQLKAQSDEIDNLKKQLQTQGANLSEAERANRTRIIDEKTKALQRSAEDAQNDAQTEMGEAYQKLAEKVYQVVQSYAAQNGYTVVLDASTQQSPVLWATQGIDISGPVVQAYNAKSGVPAPANPASGGTGVTPRTGAAPTRPAGSPATKPSTTPKP